MPTISQRPSRSDLLLKIANGDKNTHWNGSHAPTGREGRGWTKRIASAQRPGLDIGPRAVCFSSRSIFNWTRRTASKGSLASAFPDLARPPIRNCHFQTPGFPTWSANIQRLCDSWGISRMPIVIHNGGGTDRFHLSNNALYRPAARSRTGGIRHGCIKSWLL
jgi:hypothetical protein